MELLCSELGCDVKLCKGQYRVNFVLEAQECCLSSKLQSIGKKYLAMQLENIISGNLVRFVWKTYHRKYLT